MGKVIDSNLKFDSEIDVSEKRGQLIILERERRYFSISGEGAEAQKGTEFPDLGNRQILKLISGSLFPFPKRDIEQPHPSRSQIGPARHKRIRV